MKRQLIGSVFLWVVLSMAPARAQLNGVFGDLFTRILVDELQLSPGAHGNHFIAAADLANQTLTPSLNSLIAGNISSFPLSSTSAGVTFDFSSGQPVAVRESLGPIFTETGQTLGRKRFNFGVNHTVLSMDQFRGIPLSDMRFTFTHVDVTDDGQLGESPNESDTIDVFLNLDVDARITALYGTWGVTDHLDIGVAIPFVDIDLRGSAVARIDSFTFPNLGEANHNFGSDPMNPVLETTIPYGGSASGLGDVSLRVKYGLSLESSIKIAFLLDVRFATGDENDFLGSGEKNIRFTEIISKKIGGFTGHLNFGYEKREGELDSDELEFSIGFDQQLGKGLTWALDVLANTDLNDNETITLFPGSTSIFDRVGDGGVLREVDLSNIPERSNDNTVDASLGFRYAPTDHWSFLANMLIPLNDGGLRSEVVATIGVSANY